MSESTTQLGGLIDEMLRNTWSGMPVHDEDCGIVWACGECPYMNVGTICTKCGAPRYHGQPVGGRVKLYA